MCVRHMTTQSPSTWSDSSPSSPRSLANAPSLSQSPVAPGAAPQIGTLGSIRKRVVRACEVCRRKKVKCNGQKPCSHCISFAEECIYVDVKDRSAYSRRYVESLELRLAKLEHAWSMMLEHSCHPRCLWAPVPAQVGMLESQTPFHTRPSWLVSSMGRTMQSENFPSQTEGNVVPLSFLSPSRLTAQASVAWQARLPPRSPAEMMRRAEIKDESTQALTLHSLPAGSTFYALLEYFAHRVHPFFPAVSLTEAQVAWTRISSSVPLPSVSDAETVALVYAIMACGTQAAAMPMADGLTQRLATQASSLGASVQYEAQARLWTSFFEEPSAASPRTLHRLQALALLAYSAAARAESSCARAYLFQAQSLTARLVQRTEDPSLRQGLTDLLRLFPSLCMLIDGLQGLVEPLWPTADDQSPSREGEVGADLPAELGRLSVLCSLTGSVGQTLVELASFTESRAGGKELAAIVLEQERALETWYNRLPLSFRSSCSAHSEPLSAAASCIAFVSLQHERLRLHLALLHSQSAGRNGDAADAARCMQLAMHTLRACETILNFLPPSPWLALYTQCVIMAAAFVLQKAVNEPGAAGGRLVAEVEATLNGMRRLDHVVRGAAPTVDDLAELCLRIRATEDGRSEGERQRAAAPTLKANGTDKRACAIPHSESSFEGEATVTDALRPDTTPSSYAPPSSTDTGCPSACPPQWGCDSAPRLGEMTLTELWPTSAESALGLAPPAASVLADLEGTRSAAQTQADLMAGLLDGLIRHSHNHQLHPTQTH